MNNLNDDPVCCVCGVEHDPNETPELDSTHLCPQCVAAVRALNECAFEPAPLRHQEANDDQLG